MMSGSSDAANFRMVSGLRAGCLGMRLALAVLAGCVGDALFLTMSMTDPKPPKTRSPRAVTMP